MIAVMLLKHHFQHYENPTQRVGIVQNRYYYYLINK
jgi:hypothetical protein